MDKYSKISNSKKSQIKNLILSNCSFYHKQSPLPPIPYFLESQNQASSLLESLLQDSNYDPEKFSKKAAETILHYNHLDISYTLKLIKSQQEAKEIQDYLGTFSRNTEEKSTIDFKILKTLSSIGPIFGVIQINGKVFNLSASEQITVIIELEQEADIQLFVRDGDDIRVLDTFQVFFKEISKESITELKKKEIEKKVEKKSQEFEAKIGICIRLSAEDKLKILVKRLKEVEKIMSEENRAGVIYNDLIKNLEIFHDVENGRFKTTVPQVRANGRNCCATCQVV